MLLACLDFTDGVVHARTDLWLARLESVFVDLAKQHYAAEIQRVMAHVEIANPKTETVCGLVLADWCWNVCRLLGGE